ncbi:MAG TPA: TlpA disulfide reductase family protein [Pyrinomonadaceae bacterium]|nr:TlpA disulfide reductase family protein [Pyrinomonadaceae bacterium]
MPRFSWSKISALVAIVLCILILGGCAPKVGKENEPSPVLSGPPNTTYPMPPLKSGVSLGQLGWSLADGEHVTVSNYREKVLVLDFYATWCAPCRDSIPHLIDLEKRYGSKGLVIVGLNVGGPDDRAEVPGFAREFDISYALGFPDQALSDFLLSDSDAIPQTFVFDRQGQLVQRYVGYSDSTAGELEEKIKAILAG